INLKKNRLEVHENNNNRITDDWNITCADTGYNSGTALRLYNVKKFLENEEDFCLTYGDGVANVNITDLINYHKKHGKIVTITGLHPRSKFGLMVSNERNIVTDFREKPTLPDNINGGFMVFNKRIFEHLTDENEMLVTSILPKLAKLGEIKTYQFNGFWYCMDTYKDYEHLNELWKSNPEWKIWD
ncbi:MAG: sugar phosphate nucleotidyltransferase, partial [Promethearchaeota archaeon]